MFRETKRLKLEDLGMRRGSQLWDHADTIVQEEIKALGAGELWKEMESKNA